MEVGEEHVEVHEETVHFLWINLYHHHYNFGLSFLSTFISGLDPLLLS